MIADEDRVRRQAAGKASQHLLFSAQRGQIQLSNDEFAAAPLRSADHESPGADAAGKTGRLGIETDEALALGLVTEVVPEGGLDAAAARLLGELATTSPLALAMAKRVLNQAYDAPLAVGLELEGLAYGLLRTTDDFREGVEAFFEKRPPKFTGR